MINHNIACGFSSLREIGVYLVSFFLGGKLSITLDEINSSDLFITKLKTNLGTTYLLLYKNFTNKKLAIKECNNINKLKIECLVVFIDSLN